MDDHSASPEPFDAADTAFRLLCAGPQPLALHASKVAAGLPDRPVPLDELRVLLLHPSTSARARNQVWAELVRRARAGDPAWTVGLAGIAMPGLRRAAGSLAAAYRGDPADLQAEVLTGFLAAVRALDPDDLDRCRWRPGCAGPRGGPGSSTPTPTPAGPAAAAISPGGATARTCPGGTRTWCSPPPCARGSSPAEQAGLIGRNRLEGVPLSQIAAETGISHSALCNRRKKAEKAIADAIANGFSAD